jgi:hypothetical protein
MEMMSEIGVASVKPNGHKKHRESQGVLKVNSISAGVK